MKKIYVKIIKLLFVFMIGAFVGLFASGVTTVHAQQTTETIIEDEGTALAEKPESGSSAMFLLLGGMLLIILTVVITVVATFVVTAPIADEI